MPRELFNRFKPSTRVISNYPLHYAARVYVETVRGCSNYNRARVGLVGGLCSYCGECTQGSLPDRYYCPIGIPPGCGYCSVPSLFGPPKSREKTEIELEIAQLLDRGVSRIVLSAPCFLDYGRDYLVDPDPLTDPSYPEPNYSEIDDLLSSLYSLEKLKQGKASVL
ncbi:MAG: B12-binding domain-containing radical SAM protein, partial [Candidatus Thorarchaeota archaeon]|nr:B12-binding domain-containing radical SAM protein [Candidatus Thorarchaeota archaeon]NIW15666.1 B12-binding domain-containing radical SAM protein [Candidatus Thorarchaeota archaeon]NIW53596.1 B12-binding domain-containing radical SAM protein [Candidatus Korarchaeota archaeon]